MKKVFNLKTFSKLIIVFIIFQSLIDLYFLISYHSIQFFGFTIPTLIRILGVFILGIFLILSIKFKRYYLFTSLYLLSVIIYFYLHHLNSLSFNSLIPNNYNYSIFEEAFYIIRMLIPIFIIIATYFSGVSEDKTKKVIFIVPFIISLTITLSNIFVIGYGSYSDQLIKGSIFNWFSGKTYDYYEYASKGWFSSANAIASLLVLILPLVLYSFINAEKKLKWFILISFQMLAMIMLGTKVATWGFILELVVFFVTYLFFVYIKKEFKINRKVVLSFLVFMTTFILIYPYSPSYQRIKIDNMRMEDSSTREKEEKEKLSYFYNNLELLSDSEKENFKLSFIEENYIFFSINKTFIEKSYNYRYDPDFWISIFEEDYKIRTNYRLLEERMFIRLKEIDNREANEYFGLTFSRLSKVFTLEKDFVYQYYSLGWIGLILLIFVYFFVIIYSVVKMLFVNKTQFRLYNVTIMMGISVCLASAYTSGNILDTLMVTILLGFFTGHLLKNMEQKT